MKCRNITLGLILLAVLTLTSCTCKHEWVEADCMNPQICTKCEENGEPALGHHWLDATCMEPEICARCSATQGEPLGHEWFEATCATPQICSRCSEIQGKAYAHSYGDWTFDGKLMSHVCSVCNFFEELPINQGLYLESLLDGFWDYWSIDHDGDSSHGGAGTNINYLVFGENRSCQITMTYDLGTYKGSGTWELINYIESEQEKQYQIYIHTTVPRDEYLEIYLHVNPDDMNKISFTGPNHTRWFYQEQGNILDGICTGWSIFDHYTDHSYCLQFRPDHTATCYMEGVFEGTWSLGADPENRSYVSYIIEYVRDGNPEEFNGYFCLPSEYYDVPTLELHSGNQIFSFHQVNDAELAIIQGSTNLFTGTWASVGFGSLNPKFADPATMDYSLTVEKDGGFTLALRDGKTYDGSWSAYAISEGGCQYYLYFNELKKSYHCTLHTTNDDSSLSIWDSGSDAKALHFTLVPESYAVHTLPLGSWTGTDGSYFIFREDGTFSGLLDREVYGTWTFYNYDEGSYNGGELPYDDWTYLLSCEGETEPQYIRIEKYKNSEQFTLHIPVTDSDGNRIVYIYTRD